MTECRCEDESKTRFVPTSERAGDSVANRHSTKTSEKPRPLHKRLMNTRHNDNAPPAEGRRLDRPATLPKPGYDKRIAQGAFGAWHTKRSVLFKMNELHGDFRRVFFEHFRALLEETNDEAFLCRMVDYVRWILSMYMFVRVERPRGSKHFVLGYVKCDRVFSFALRFEQMRLRLSRVPPTLLTKIEHGENKALRLACVGDTDYERAVAIHSDTRVLTGFDNILLTPLGAAIYVNDEESAVALLDGGDDPNAVDQEGWNALHRAAEKGCRPPLLQRLMVRIQDVNAGNNNRFTALMAAASNNQLDVAISLMNHPGIDLNVQGISNCTALHWAVHHNHPAIVSQLLSDDKIDASLKDCNNNTALKRAIDRGRAECVTILRQHGAPEE